MCRHGIRRLRWETVLNQSERLDNSENAENVATRIHETAVFCCELLYLRLRRRLVCPATSHGVALQRRSSVTALQPDGRVPPSQSPTRIVRPSFRMRRQDIRRLQSGVKCRLRWSRLRMLEICSAMEPSWGVQHCLCRVHILTRRSIADAECHHLVPKLAARRLTTYSQRSVTSSLQAQFHFCLWLAFYRQVCYLRRLSNCQEFRRHILQVWTQFVRTTVVSDNCHERETEQSTNFDLIGYFRDSTKRQKLNNNLFVETSHTDCLSVTPITSNI